MVSAAAALIVSLKPTFSYTEVTNYLNSFVDDLGSSGYDTGFGFGRLNIYKTLLAVSNGTPIPSDTSSPGKTYPMPNPYNPTLGQVYFAVPQSLGTDGIEIKIMNVAGEVVKNINGSVVSGKGIPWDGKNNDGNYVSSGFYFYILKTSAGQKTGKLTVLK